MLQEQLTNLHLHRANALELDRRAAIPCNGEHGCEEDHSGADCDCYLTCECLDPAEYRQDAALQAALAQAAATAANALALVLAHDSD